MATAAYWQRGESLDYVNETDDVIEAGTVIDLSTRIGVAGCDIEAGATGSLHVIGVFEIAKTTATEEIAMGADVYFDGTGITATSGSTPAGYAAVASTADDETVYVKLLG
ncbi:MAG: DUF2190 family protein [Lachnospiraceae bacterium]|nr:DUF2190 family protein [Lachnospiraceae bacterium]